MHHGQEGFHPLRNTTRQIQEIITAIEDAKFTNQDINLTYIDFKTAFGSIDHLRVLAIMEGIGYTPNTIALIGDIYVISTTKYHGALFITTPPIQISHGTIQGDT